MRRPASRLLRPLLAATGLAIGGAALALALQATGCGSWLAGTTVCQVAMAPSASPNPTAPATKAMSPLAIEIPADADCNGCHVKRDGTVGLNPIPAVGHPVEGWQDCTACHVATRLVQTAPGHTGIHKDECLVCHTRSTSLPSPRPHPPIRNTGCFECHGKTAPLPDDMSHRSETSCWLCHRAAPQPAGDLTSASSSSPARLSTSAFVALGAP